MTTCNPTKIRDLIATHLGKEKLTEYDYAVDQCKLGQALKDDRVWAHLCPEYPNLKGVTCEEIDEFVGEKPHEFFSTKEYQELCRLTRDPVRQIEFDETTEERIKRFFFSVKKQMSEDEFNAFKKTVSPFNTVERIMERIENLKFTDNTQFTKDYFHHIKVYDRDEEYEAFKNIGDQIETDMPRVLHDPSTIFVTTPRGGHEMLSIFTYANEIDKAQIPSDIKFQHTIGGTPISEAKYREDPISSSKYLESIGYDPKEEIPTDVYGQTWLNNMSMHVKNIFIVDDIIASGEQIYKTAMSLEEMFPDANINSITLCKRENIKPALPMEVNNYYTDTKTIGIKKFKEHKGKRDLFYKEYITCLFPHACPDGESDKPMIELMGERCSPEKRIARRDL